jgi:WD40 repeat protein
VTSANAGGADYAVRFTPNNTHIASCGNSTNKQLVIYSWNGSNTLSEACVVNVGSLVQSCSWHPNGNYLATAINTSGGTNSLDVFSWNGTNTLTSVTTKNLDGGARWVDWHPSTEHLAVVARSTISQDIGIYEWNGSNTLTIKESLALGAAHYCCTWSPDGDYIAIGSQLSNKSLVVYSWDGVDTLTEEAAYNGNLPSSVVWTSDGAYLFTAETTTTTTIRSYYFNGSSLTLKQTINLGLTGFDIHIFNDTYVVAVGYGASVTSVACVKLYSFDVGTETLTLVDDLTYTAYGSLAVRFDSTGKYLGIGMFGETNVTLRIANLHR